MQQITKQEKAQRLEKLAWILDSVIPIPGTNWRIGLDGLIGLIPGVGDISAGAISTYILYQKPYAWAFPQWWWGVCC